MIKVLIADDQKLLCESLKNIIENDSEISVIGSAENGSEAFEMCKSEEVDLVLMDINMPVCDGIEGTRLIKEHYPEIKVLILTTFEDDQNVYEALKSGADGYVLKEITPQELIQAVRNTSKGFGIFSKSPFDSVMRHINTHAENEKIVSDLEPELKERDIQIIRLVVIVMSYREIAMELCLSVGRMKNVISCILGLLGFSDRNQLAGFAYKNKLLQ